MSLPRKLTQYFPNALVFPMYGLEWRVVYPGSFVLGDEVDAAWPVPPDYYSHPHNKAFNQPPLSQRQTSNGMTKLILYHKTNTAWQKSYCMSFAMPSYFPWIHGKTHVISALLYPWFFPCSNLSLVSQLFAFDSTSK